MAFKELSFLELTYLVWYALQRAHAVAKALSWQAHSVCGIAVFGSRRWQAAQAYHVILSQKTFVCKNNNKYSNTKTEKGV